MLIDLWTLCNAFCITIWPGINNMEMCLLVRSEKNYCMLSPKCVLVSQWRSTARKRIQEHGGQEIRLHQYSANDHSQTIQTAKWNLRQSRHLKDLLPLNIALSLQIDVLLCGCIVWTLYIWEYWWQSSYNIQVVEVSDVSQTDSHILQTIQTLWNC